MSLTGNSTAASAADLRQRVILCLNKLSDRDTLSLATTELESIARNLSHDSFSPFLNCLSATDSSDKSPVRKQCVRLLGFLSAAHGDALSPHLSKMLSSVLRRLRDSDSAVRSACVDSVSSMASQITKPPFSLFLKPLVDAVLHEQDHNSQIGSAMCLAAAIDASPDPEPAHLQKLLPKLLKLVRNDCFKAKPALFSLVGSIASAGGAGNRNMLSALVPTLVEFLKSEDWAVRKAVAEALARLAVAERELLTEFRSSCLTSLENRRFDKVKVVRDTMNGTLEVWKEVPGIPEKVLPQSQSLCGSSSKDGDAFSPLSRSSCKDCFETPKPKKTSFTSRSPSSDNSFATAAPRRSPSTNGDKMLNTTMLSKQDSKNSHWKVETALPQPSALEVACADGLKDRCVGDGDKATNESNTKLKFEMKRALFRKNFDEKVRKFGSLRSGSRVVPFYDNDYCNSDVVRYNANGDVDVDQEFEDLNLIRKQLVQIENQQSSLLELLQRFIGSSQSGMNSLETRVNGIEKALDEISHDLAVSTGMISDAASARNSCCMIRGAEFWSPKFWRRAEGQFTSSRFSLSGRNATHPKAGMQKMDSPRDHCQSGSGTNLEEKLDACSSRNVKIMSDGDKVKAHNGGGFDGSSRNISCRSSAHVGS